MAALGHFHEDVSLRGRPEDPPAPVLDLDGQERYLVEEILSDECSKEKYSIWSSGLVTMSLPGSREPTCLMSLVHRLFHYKNISRPKGGGDNVTASQFML